MSTPPIGESKKHVFVMAQQLQAIAQTGLEFTRDHYDIERYKSIRKIAADLLAAPGSEQNNSLANSFELQGGYGTPKVDVRAVVLREGRILMIRESQDGLWSLPGGWADVGDTPSQAIIREVFEETGLNVVVERLLGLWDRNLHGHPPHAFHIYKLFFLCTETGGTLTTSEESLAVEFFDPAKLPPLSLTRLVPVEVEKSLEIARQNLPTYFD